MFKPRVGVVGIPGKWSTEILADAIASATGFRLVIDMAEVVLDLHDASLRYQDFDLTGLDALVVKKISAEYSPATLDRLAMLQIAENRGVRVFSGVENMQRLINRLDCTVILRNAGIAMPATSVTESVDQAISRVKQYQSAVFKPLFSTKARGMMLLDEGMGDAALREKITEYQQRNPVLYIQQKLDLNGRDYGLVFLGGKYLGGYARVSQNNAWNTTINSGGKYQEYHPDDEILALAERAQAAFAMDFTTVDVAETDQGPIVFEVSAFGGFKGALEGAGFDAASAYAHYILEQLQ